MYTQPPLKLQPQPSTTPSAAANRQLYHASRESFLYLREFYIGELLPGEELPQGGASPAPPSAEFLSQLAAYTAGFRMDPSRLPQGGRAFKSF
jgi:hypothetical protein